MIQNNYNTNLRGDNIVSSIKSFTNRPIFDKQRCNLDDAIQLKLSLYRSFRIRALFFVCFVKAVLLLRSPNSVEL